MGIVNLFAAALVVVLLGGSLLAATQLLFPPRHTAAWALASHVPLDPGGLGAEFVEEDLVLADGARTAVWLIEGGRHDGPVLVVSHGWGESRLDYLPRLGPLLPLFSRVALYDLRGHGDSTARVSRLGSREIDDLLRLLDHLDRTNGRAARGYVLLGGSMGAATSVGAAARDASGRIRGVVAEGPCRRLSDALASMLRSMGYPAWPFTWLTCLLVWPWAGGVAWADRARDARRLTCPLLVLRGAGDAVCGAQTARALAAACPRGRYVELAGAGHVDLARPDPARYLDALRHVLPPDPP